MAKISQLLKNKRELAVDIGDGEMLVITYQPGAITPARQDESLDLLEKQRSGTAVVKLLAQTLLGWDLVDENGNPYPITQDSLRDLPLQILYAVSVAIQNDTVPNAQKSGTSGGSF